MKGNSNIHNPKYTPGWGGNVQEPTGYWRITSPKLRADSRRAPRYVSKCYISSHNYRSALATRRHPPTTTK